MKNAKEIYSDLKLFEDNMDRSKLFVYDEVLTRSDFVVDFIDILCQAIEDYENTKDVFENNDIEIAIKAAYGYGTERGLCYYMSEMTDEYDDVTSALVKIHLEKDSYHISNTIGTLYEFFGARKKEVFTESITKRVSAIKKIVGDLLLIKTTHEVRIQMLYIKNLDNFKDKFFKSNELFLDIGLCYKLEKMKEKYDVPVLDFIPVESRDRIFYKTITSIWAEYSMGNSCNSDACREMNESIDARLELLNRIDKNIYEYLKEKYKL